MTDTMRGMPAIGTLPAGALDSIADVPGVTVGHCTLDEAGLQTGVTVIRPHAGNLYADKVPAAATVINGFGKSVGLVQVEELGVLETPIALTNTFSVGAAAQAQIREAITANPEVGSLATHRQSAGVRVQRRLSQRYPGNGRQRTPLRNSLRVGGYGV